MGLKWLEGKKKKKSSCYSCGSKLGPTEEVLPYQEEYPRNTPGFNAKAQAKLGKHNTPHHYSSFPIKEYLS